MPGHSRMTGGIIWQVQILELILEHRVSWYLSEEKEWF